MNKCDAIIKSGPRKGLRCMYNKKIPSSYCNKHNYKKDKKKYHLSKNNINKFPNEIINTIINYLGIKDIINLRLINKRFLLICNDILNNYINTNKLLYANIKYNSAGSYYYILCKILKIYKKKIEIAPLKIDERNIIKKESKYLKGLPVYETYEIKYDISLINLDKKFYVYKIINNDNIEFYSKKKEYFGISFKIWNKEKLFEHLRYDI
jgi:hypothetical protein